MTNAKSKRKKLPPATDWRARDISDWNATTFRSYLADTHAELYGIPYVTRSYGMEAKLIRDMIDQHGVEIVKAFIDACFSEYKPTRQYPGINFAFMFTYMRGRILPRLIAENLLRKEREFARKTQNDGLSYEELAEWL